MTTLQSLLSNSGKRTQGSLPCWLRCDQFGRQKVYAVLVGQPREVAAELEAGDSGVVDGEAVAIGGLVVQVFGGEVVNGRHKSLIKAAVTDQGHPIFCAAMFLQNGSQYRLSAVHRLIAWLWGTIPPTLFANFIGQDEIGKLSQELGAIGARQPDWLSGSFVIQIDAGYFVEVGQGHEGQLAGLGHVHAGLDGAYHEGAVEVGEAEAVTIEGVGGVTIWRRGGLSQEVGQVLGLLVTNGR